jgi:hypothetical protein
LQKAKCPLSLSFFVIFSTKWAFRRGSDHLDGAEKEEEEEAFPSSPYENTLYWIIELWDLC